MGGLIAGATPACILIDDPAHCASNDECQDGWTCESTCPATNGFKGCVPPSGECSADDGSTTLVGSGSTSLDSSTTADSTSSTGGTDSTGSTSECNDPDGTFGEDCDPLGDTPFCVSGQCEPCSDADPLRSCPGGTQGVCIGGACVECSAEDTEACPESEPACAPDNTCVPCTEHDQCSPSACNLFTGECVGGMVVEITPGADAILDAVAMVGAEGTIIMGSGDYDESIIVDTASTVAFLAAPAATVEWQRTAGGVAPQLRVAESSTVLMDRVELRLNDSTDDPALRVSSSQLWMDRSIIAQNQGTGLYVQGSSEVVLRNSFISTAIDQPALDIQGSANVSARYVTIGAGAGSATAVQCDNLSTVLASDSIVISRSNGTPPIDCDGFMADHSAGNDVLPGMDNVAVMATQTGWFSNYNAGDFHLTASGDALFVGVAQWSEGPPRDPAVDIDGMSRTTVDGTPEHAGADLP